MSKRIQSKIKEKHPDIWLLTNKENFSKLLNNTIASTQYDKNDDTLNFIAYFKEDNKYILYSLKREKHHTVCSTIFSLKPKTLKKYFLRDDFKTYNNKSKKIIEEYIKS